MALGAQVLRHQSSTKLNLGSSWVELSWFYLAIINIQLEKNTNQCKDARALKEPEGCREPVYKCRVLWQLLLSDIFQTIRRFFQWWTALWVSRVFFYGDFHLKITIPSLLSCYMSQFVSRWQLEHSLKNYIQNLCGLNWIKYLCENTLFQFWWERHRSVAILERKNWWSNCGAKEKSRGST